MRTIDEIITTVDPGALKHLDRDKWDRVKDAKHLDGRGVGSLVFNGYGTWVPFAGYDPDNDDIYAPRWCLSREEVELYFSEAVSFEEAE